MAQERGLVKTEKVCPKKEQKLLRTTVLARETQTFKRPVNEEMWNVNSQRSWAPGIPAGDHDPGSEHSA